MGFIDRSRDGLSARIVLACAIVFPAFLVLGQISIPLFDTGFCDRTDEQGRAEHIFILLLKGLWVVGKVKNEGAHEGVSFFGYTLSTLLNVRTQFLALFQTLSNNLLGFCTIVPGLCVAHIAMNSHQRQIDRSFYPSQHAFDIVLIGVLVTRTEESTSVVGPPRYTSSLDTQSCHNLTTESLPIVAHIATPQGRTIALNAWESATGENHRLTTSSYQSFINGLVNQQGIDITHLLTTPAPIVHTTSH